MKEPISAVIPNRDGAQLLRQTLPLLLREAPAGENDIVIVDDASRDESVAMLHAEFPAVRVLAVPENVGFGAACNLGLREARHDLVLLMNSDMQVTPGSLALLREHFDNPRVFAAGPPYPSPEQVAATPPAPGRVGRQMNAPAGGGFFRRDAFLELGGFDPIYHPFYWEDMDLGWNAWRRGWEIVLDSRCYFIHPESSTIRSLYQRRYVSRVRTRNRCLFGWKNLRSRSLLARFLAFTLARALLAVPKRRDPSWLQGIADSIPRLRPALARRQATAYTGKSDQEILKDSETSWAWLLRV